MSSLSISLACKRRRENSARRGASSCAVLSLGNSRKIEGTARKGQHTMARARRQILTPKNGCRHRISRPQVIHLDDQIHKRSNDWRHSESLNIPVLFSFCNDCAAFWLGRPLCYRGPEAWLDRQLAADDAARNFRQCCDLVAREDRVDSDSCGSCVPKTTAATTAVPHRQTNGTGDV